jgi:tryptophanyl-tRNA synthetase
VAALAPLQEKYTALLTDRTYLESVLRQGNAKAAGIAQQTLLKVKDALGYSRPL